MDREIRNRREGTLTRKPSREQKENTGTQINMWTERIIVCRKCGWQGTECEYCPGCGIPLSNYSLEIVPI